MTIMLKTGNIVKIIRDIIIGTLINVVFFSLSSNAESLKEMLSSSYKNSEKIKAKQQKFLEEVEIFPSTFAKEFMPKVNLELSRSNKKDTNTITKASGRQNATSRSITVEQPVFNGGSGAANLASANAKGKYFIAKYYEEEQKFFLEAIKAYVNLVVTTNKIKEVDSYLDSQKKIYESEVSRYNLGQSTKINLSTAEANMFSAESRKANIVFEYEKAKLDFYSYFGNMDTSNIDWPMDFSDVPSSLEEFRKKVIASNYQAEQLRNSMKYTKYDVAASVGDILPQVSLVYSQGKNQQYQNHIRTVSTALRVNLPIFSQGGAEYSRIRSAKSKSRESVYNLNDGLKEIENNASNIWNQHSLSKISCEASEKAQKSFLMAFQSTSYGYELGDKSLLDVMKAQSDLYDSNNKVIDIKSQLVISYYQIKLLMGDLTARRMRIPGVVFNPESEFKKAKVKIIGF